MYIKIHFYTNMQATSNVYLGIFLCLSSEHLLKWVIHALCWLDFHCTVEFVQCMWAVSRSKSLCAKCMGFGSTLNHLKCFQIHISVNFFGFAEQWGIVVFELYGVSPIPYIIHDYFEWVIQVDVFYFPSYKLFKYAVISYLASANCLL